MDFGSMTVAGLALAFTVINTIYGWYSGTQRATKAEVEKHGHAIVALQAELKSMPSQENFHKLQLDVVEMRGEQRLFSEQIKPLVSGIKRIEEFLLDTVKSSTPRTRK
jgi:Protein of unknown function (DUF2730)